MTVKLFFFWFKFFVKANDSFKVQLRNYNKSRVRGKFFIILKTEKYPKFSPKDIIPTELVLGNFSYL